MLTAVTGCDLNEEFYSEATPSTFFSSPESVYSILARPFSHWEWYISYSPSADGGSQNFLYSECVTDVFCVPYRDAADWLDGGNFVELHHHEWSAESTRIRTAYTAPMEGIARCLAAIEDLSAVDYPSINLTEADKADHIAQLKALTAYFYQEALNRFGGLPIYTSSQDKPKARNTDKELFDHIEALLLEGISGATPTLRKKTAGQESNGYITQGAAAAILARLYFNAEQYIGESRYAQCSTLCEQIIAGDYGPYALETDWMAPFGFSNRSSNELIWATPQNSSLRNSGTSNMTYHFYPPHMGYFGMSRNPWNGMSLQPSRNPETEAIYTQWNLGTPFEKFDDGDLRKQPFGYKGNDEYQGMFMMGELTSPTNPEWKSVITVKAKGNQTASTTTTKLVDYVSWKHQNDYTSDMMHAEANSCYRLVKYPLKPDTEASTRYEAYLPVIRLAEIHYMLAECKMRAGDKQGAADIINNIRKRNFPGEVDPNPVTAVNLDDNGYRMLDEWLVEFIGEGTGRRRTDLIRFDKFVTENWWDHTASNNRNLHRFPLPTNALTGNPLLVQNPGY